MTPEQLISSLESLTHDSRMRNMVEIGAASQTDAAPISTIDILEQGNFYDRMLALQSVHGSRDGERALRAISDPSRIIRARAITIISVVGDDTQIRTALETVHFKHRSLLIKRLHERRRYKLIDSFLTQLADREDRQLNKLLPYGSPDLVHRYLQQALKFASDDDWCRMARKHPNIVVSELQKRSESLTDLDRTLLWQINITIPFLAEFCPDPTLKLVKTVSKFVSLSEINWQKLADRRPINAAKIIIESEDKVNVNFDRVAHKLPTELIIKLLEKQRHTLGNNWFPKITPQQRKEIFADRENIFRTDDGCLSDRFIKLLPGKLREKEARYQLNLPILATRPHQRLPYAAFLPWDEALTILKSYIGDPDPELRKVALSTIIDATRFHRSRLAELLKIVRDRRNEQDPIRGIMLSGLASLPPSMWQQEHLKDLEQIIEDAIDAADLSNLTASAIERLIISILPFHPQWSVIWLSVLVKERGRVNFFNLGSRLNDRQVERLAPIILPVLQSWETRERISNLLNAASSFGRRLEVFDRLVDILERILKETRESWVAWQILNIIGKWRRDRLPSLIPKLLAEDKSWIEQPVVYNYLHRKRQDLLTPFLGQKVYKGRFSTGKTRFLLPVSKDFFRWTPSQQSIFAKTLEDLSWDSDRDTPTLLFAIDQLAALPAIQPTRLLELASLNNPKQALRERALRALSRVDGGKGIPTLLEALSDDRARIAIYALRRCILQMPVNDAVSILKSASWHKITVAKEIIRLLGELPSLEAYREILAIEKQDLHRDVRVALLRSLWEHLERDESWVILNRSAVSEDRAIATMVGRIPNDGLSPEARQKLLSLLAILLNHPDPTVRLDILRRCYQLPVTDTQQLLLPRLLAALNSKLLDEINAAATAIVSTYSQNNPNVIAEAVDRILNNRRTLSITIQTLYQRLYWQRSQLLPSIRAVISKLSQDPITLTLQIKLAVPTLPWSELSEFFQQNIQQMHGEALFTAVSEIEAATRRSDISQIEQFETALATNNDERLRRLALAALVTIARSLGWNDDRIQRLQIYQNDPSNLVASAAQFIFPHFATL